MDFIFISFGIIAFCNVVTATSSFLSYRILKRNCDY